jgi:hypothetical protein
MPPCPGPELVNEGGIGSSFIASETKAEGVEAIKGEDVLSVVIEKLPFSSPSPLSVRCTTSDVMSDASPTQSEVIDTLACSLLMHPCPGPELVNEGGIGSSSIASDTGAKGVDVTTAEMGGS